MRRSFALSTLVLLISTSFALAQQQPGVPVRVLVAQFTEANEEQQPDWITRAIQQSVTDELASLESVEVVPSNGATTSPTTAQAKDAGAQYIVRGTIQRLGGELRVTGRVENVADGKTVGGFKATGPQEQLFAIEDSLAAQITRAVAPMEATPAGLEDARTVAQRPPTLPQQPIRSTGVFEGSDLQRALEDRDYIRRTARRGEIGSGGYDTPVYYPPTYPAGYGGGIYPPLYPGYGYGYGWGWGWGGDTNIIIVKPGKGHDGHHGGGGGGIIKPRVPIADLQTQRLRNAAVFPGQSGNFIGPVPPRAPVPGTMRGGGSFGGGSFRGGGGSFVGGGGNVAGPAPSRAPAPGTQGR